jgi:magnesium-transporting ATPase (P-type)
LGVALLARQSTDPIVLILLFAVLAAVAGDLPDGLIILAIVALRGLLGFWQEHRAGRAVQRLLALVQVHADVRRDGAVFEVPPAEVVPGDVVVLGAGDIIPATAASAHRRPAGRRRRDERAVHRQDRHADRGRGAAARRAGPCR